MEYKKPKIIIKSFDPNKAKNSKTLKNAFKTEDKYYKQNKTKGFDLLLLGDLTGSMEDYRDSLRIKFKELCNTLFDLIDDLQIGIIFYLDHLSGDPYVSLVHPLSKDISSLLEFIEKAPNGHGGDEDEALEDALFDAYNINWNENSKKSIIIFGDARPHEVQDCVNGYDYFEITKQLFKNKKVTINTVFCDINYNHDDIAKMLNVDIGQFSKRFDDMDHAEFFAWIANVTGGIAIGVEHIDNIVSIIEDMVANDAGVINELDILKKKMNSSIKMAHNMRDYIKQEHARKTERKRELGI